MRDVYALARDLLDRMVAWFETQGIDLPASQYVAPGATVAYDTEQITVNVVRIGRGQPSNDDVYLQFRPWFAELQVLIIRDTPVMLEDGTPPSTAALFNSAQENISDLTTLGEGLETILADQLNPWIPRQSQIIAGPAEPVGPEGGVVGALISVTVELT